MYFIMFGILSCGLTILVIYGLYFAIQSSDMRTKYYLILKHLDQMEEMESNVDRRAGICMAQQRVIKVWNEDFTSIYELPSED